MESRRRLAQAMAEAVRESKVPHVVLMSSAGGQLASGTGLILVNYIGEEAMKPVARSLTILRLGSFVENWEPVLMAAKAKLSFAHVSFTPTQAEHDRNRRCGEIRGGSAPESRERKPNSQSGRAAGVQPGRHRGNFGFSAAPGSASDESADERGCADLYEIGFFRWTRQSFSKKCTSLRMRANWSSKRKARSFDEERLHHAKCLKSC